MKKFKKFLSQKNSVWSLMKSKNNKGQLLIESIIGITIIVVALLGILGLVSHSLSLNRVVADQLIANYLAMEGIEVVKNIIDNNIAKEEPWNSGLNNGSFELDYQSLTLQPSQERPLLFNPLNGLYSYQSGNSTSFIRNVNIQLIGADEIKVNSIVKWRTRGGGTFEINLEDYFFNWRS